MPDGVLVFDEENGFYWFSVCSVLSCELFFPNCKASIITLHLSWWCDSFRWFHSGKWIAL